MFEQFRFNLHKTVFLNYNRYLRQIIDLRQSGRCSEDQFRKCSERYFAILQKHYQRAFDLSRRLHGVPDQNLHRAWESVQQHYERNRFRKPETRDRTPGDPCGEVRFQVGNEFYQRSEAEIRAWVERTLRECTDARGVLNGEAVFLKLLDAYLQDEFLRLARRLGGPESPHPADLFRAQLGAMVQCHRDNPACFGSDEKFEHFRALVEQNLNVDQFYREHLERYRDAARAVRSSS
ncbi:MAG: hypothetical protein HYU36_25265 [Planctomycetes bacterium]|nr:hypothetical protein [Planctomycetota bacterium]